MISKEFEKLEGVVENIVFHSEITGFVVMEMSCDNELITVVGELLDVNVGEHLCVTGVYTTHPTYGSQFKGSIFERKLPDTAAAIFKYLQSGAIKGVGPKIAMKLVETFGGDTLDVIEKTPQRLTEINGISPKKASKISESYQKIFGIRSVMIFLAKYGIEPAASIKIWKRWGMLAPETIMENPYVLCEDEIGIIFEKADEIASIMEIEKNSPNRIKAGLNYVLGHNLLNGHTCLPVHKLYSVAALLLDLDEPTVQDVLKVQIENEELISKTIGTEYIYLPPLFTAETYIASRLRMMCMLSEKYANHDDKVDFLEETLNIKYALKQRIAINMSLSSSVFILTGGPGTGKTTTLNGLINLLELEGLSVLLAAPTGRASKRMSEVTLRLSKTIHRLLEVDFKDENGKNKFKRNESNPLNADVVIIDEVSMVDTLLMEALMRALKINCKLILVGDPDQLPSVGAGNVLWDMIKSLVIPTVHLNEVFRQAAQSLIVTNAHCIVTGDYPDLTKKNSDFFFLNQNSYEMTAATVVDLCLLRLPKAYKFSPFEDIQIIVPSRIGALGTVELNKIMQAALNPPALRKQEFKYFNTVFRVGDKVMQIRNNYDIIWTKESDDEQGTGVFNGDIGVIDLIDRPSQSILIKFDERLAEYSFDMAGEIEHAYAITVHKSQGSEFEAVLMPLMSYHSKLYYRNLLYTAVTRAKKLLILLGKEYTINQMVDNKRETSRYTNLIRFLCMEDEDFD